MGGAITFLKKSNLHERVNLITVVLHFLDCLIEPARWYFRISRSARKEKETICVICENKIRRRCICDFAS